MAINRYNLPAQQPLINTYAPLPFKELLLAGQSMQKQKDDLEAQRLELAGKEFDFLQQDVEQAREAQDWINTESERIAGLYGTDLRAAKKGLTQFQLDAAKRFGKFGDIGAMQSSYDTYAAWDKEAKERLAKGDITQDQYAKVKAGLLGDYTGIGEGGPQGYNPFSTTQVADYYDFADFANTYGKGFEAALNEKAYAATDGMYIKEGKTAYEVLSPEEIESTLMQFAAGDDKLKNYLQQGMKYGYTSYDALESAISAAGQKYDVNRIMEDRSMKGDPHFQYLDKKAEEAKAKEFAHSQDYTHLIPGDAASMESIMQEEYNSITTLETSIYDQKEAIAANYPLDENGNLLDPSLQLNYQSDMADLQQSESALATLKTKNALNMDIFAQTYGEVYGKDPSTMEMISVNPDANHFVYLDKTSVSGYKDADGNTVYYNENFSEPITPEIEKYMAENNYTPIHTVKTENYESGPSVGGWADNQKQYNNFINLLDERQAKSEDYTITGYSEMDFENSNQLSIVKEDIFSNPESYTVKEMASDGTYKDTGKTLKNYYAQFGKDAGLWSVPDVVTGKTALETKSKLTGELGDKVSSQIMQLPNGKKVILTPTKTHEQSHKEMMSVAHNEIYQSSKDPVYEMKVLEDLMPHVVSRVEDFKQQVGGYKTADKGQTINTDPIPLGAGYYAHVGTIDKQGKTNVWVNTNSGPEEYPSESLGGVNEINLNNLKNETLGLAKIILLNK